MPLRCLVIDDSQPVLDALPPLLSGEGIDVVAVAGTGAAGVGYALVLEPDVILLDIDLGPESGFDVARDLHAAGSRAAVIFTSASEDYAEMAREERAAGFLPKAAVSGDAIRDLWRGADARAPSPRPSAR